jgi:hypothetical protein
MPVGLKRIYGQRAIFILLRSVVTGGGYHY